MEYKSENTLQQAMEESSSNSSDFIPDKCEEAISRKNVKKYNQKNSNGKRTMESVVSSDENGARSCGVDKPIRKADTNGDDDEETPEEEEKRLRSNYQERLRMNRFNAALNSLRRCIPDQFRLGSRRLSKIRTLRLAISYIAALSDILKKDSQNGLGARQKSVPVSPLTFFGHGEYGDIFPGNDHSAMDSFAETPSRMSLRDMAERGLSLSTNIYNTMASTTPYRPPSWSGRSSVGTPSGESSEDSFCSDHRLLGDSPDAFSVSAFLRENSQQAVLSAGYLAGETPDALSAAAFLRSHFVSGYSSPYGNSTADSDNCFSAYSPYDENQLSQFRSALNYSNTLTDGQSNSFKQCDSDSFSIHSHD